jgi:hypothetical protein
MSGALALRRPLALRWPLVVRVLALGALTGCSTPVYDHVELSGTAGPTLEVSLQEGSVVEVTATPMSADGPLGGDFTFDLTSNDDSVLGVEPALGQPAGAATFVFFGVAPGSTQVNVTVGGQPETPIPATVTAQ